MQASSMIGGIQIIGVTYDYIAVAYPSSTVETFTYKTGGASGETIRVVTVTYTTSDKDILSSIAITKP